MDTKKKGDRYEKNAVALLQSKGYQIIVTNYRFQNKEIDIICSKDDSLVFVEVKGGESTKYGDPVYRVDQRKQANIIKAAQGYIQESETKYQSYRFDVIVIYERIGELTSNHIKAAFTA